MGPVSGQEEENLIVTESGPAVSILSMLGLSGGAERVESRRVVTGEVAPLLTAQTDTLYLVPGLASCL